VGVGHGFRDEILDYITLPSEHEAAMARSELRGEPNGLAGHDVFGGRRRHGCTVGPALAIWLKNVALDAAFFRKPEARGTHLGRSKTLRADTLMQTNHLSQVYPCGQGAPYAP
jgi:hypothetical protein